MDNRMNYEEEVNKTNGCKQWKAWFGCCFIIGIGLAVGLGVGLSNQNKKTCDIINPEQPTTKPPIVTTTSQNDEGPWNNFRLPHSLIPFHYSLKLRPDMETDLYTGRNIIDFNVLEETRHILFHVDAKLEIISTNVFFVNGDTVETIKYTREFRYGLYEYWVIETEKNLQVTTGDDATFYQVDVQFSGSLIGKIVGLYKSVYIDPSTGEEKGIVGSDMEPTDARKAYPCFDEPQLKVKYSTTLVHREKYSALSNMNMKEQRQSDEEGWIETEFYTSPMMSTYLGCFVVSDFGSITTYSKRTNVTLKVYLPKHQIAAGQADYSLEVLKAVFDYYEEYFRIDFPLPKMDMIAIPNFGTGAMENWGLITYRETNLLYDENASSADTKQRVAQVVAHEMVHQWFGNLVTMKWWDNIWLNEGFASYFEYIGQDIKEPEWDVLNHFIVDDEQPVLRIDSSVTSHPIVQPVSNPSEITSLFDTISYSKGASFIRIMDDVLGEDLMMGSLSYYLEKRQYSSVNHYDLFNDMQEYIDQQDSTALREGFNISTQFLPWVEQLGYPVVKVEQINNGSLIATQKHFLSDSNADLSLLPETQWNYKWNIEISFITKNDPNKERRYLSFDNDEGVVLTSSLDDMSWIKLNPGQKGYYRVTYDDRMWQIIADQLATDHEAFNEVDRSNLLDDAFNLAPAKIISYQQALDMTIYLNEETSYYVWESFGSGSSYIRIMLENSGNTQVYSKFKTFFLSKVQPIATERGWDATQGSHNDKLNRYTVLSLALRYGSEQELRQATTYFENWIADEDYFLYPDTSSLVYRYGIAATGSEQWELMLSRYTTEENASEKSKLLRGLASTEDIVLIDRMLEYCKNESIIKSQDFFTAIRYVSYTPTGNRMAWQWVQLNWEYMVERFGITDRNFGRIVPYIAEDWNTQIQLWELTSFFERFPEAGAGESGRLSTINAINENIRWVEENIASIDEWLTNNLNNNN